MRPLVLTLVLPTLLTGAPLRLELDLEGAANRFLRDERVSVHLLAAGRPRPRVVLAVPEQNTGTAVWLAAPGDEPPGVEVLEDPRSSGEPLPASVRAEVRVEAPWVRVEDFLLGSVRSLRDRNVTGRLERAGTLREVEERLRGDPRFAALVERLEAWRRPPAREGGRLVLERTTLDGRHRLRASLEPLAGTRWGETVAGPALLGRDGVRFRLTLAHDLPRLVPLPADELLGPGPRETLASLEDPALREELEEGIDRLSFLVYDEKALAGSWRFLTYFGRDTLLTLTLLRPLLSARAQRALLGSVLERLGPEGRVAHEENLGDQAALDRLVEYRERAGDEGEEPARRWLAARLPVLGAPTYDRSAVDDDLMVPARAAEVLAGLTPEDREAFLSREAAGGGTYRDRLAWNAARVLARAEAGEVPLREDLNVGDWRDSQRGLGGGRRPWSAEVGLMPGALAALEESGLLDPGRALRLQQRWAGIAGSYRIRLPADEVRARLRAYLVARSPEVRDALLGAPLPDGRPLRDFVEGGASPFGPILEFDALSLERDGTPVPVMHSDAVLRLHDARPGELSVEELSDWIRPFELPFPLGLDTPVGFLVASPALSGDPARWAEFDRDQYHGEVVWAWQLAMLEGALRDLAPEVEALDPALARRWTRLRERTRATRERLGALASEELWTWEVEGGKLVAAPYGARGTSATESNTLQLWSHAYLRPALTDAAER